MMQCLDRSDQGKREFRCVHSDPPVYVYTFHLNEQVLNSSVPLLAWDDLAKIRCVEQVIPEGGVLVDVDFYPFFFDNIELARSRSDSVLKSVMSGRNVENCGKYFYSMRQIGVDWNEQTWTKRLYWCIKEHEEKLSEMGVTVFDLSSDGPTWCIRLPMLFCCPQFSGQFTQFKGVTDILLVGKKHALLILSTREQEMDYIHQKVNTGIEVSIAKPKLVDCKRNGEYLPPELGELLASMYMVGVMSVIEKDLHNLDKITVFGWLLFRGTFSIGVKLDLGKDCCSIQILWQRGNHFTTMSEQFQYFLTRIS